jgi:hypothetical protein
MLLASLGDRLGLDPKSRAALKLLKLHGAANWRRLTRLRISGKLDPNNVYRLERVHTIPNSTILPSAILPNAVWPNAVFPNAVFPKHNR